MSDRPLKEILAPEISDDVPTYVRQLGRAVELGLVKTGKHFLLDEAEARHLARWLRDNGYLE